MLASTGTMTEEDLAPTAVKSENEDIVKASPTPDQAATPEADKQVSEPETSTGKGEAEPGRANARIQNLVNQKNAANAAAEEARARAEKAIEEANLYRRQLEALKPFKADEVNHQDQASLIRAQLREGMVEAQRENLEHLKQQAEARVAEEKHKAFLARADEFKARGVSDFDMVYRTPHEGGPNIQDAMAEAIRESEMGPAIAYHLFKNPNEANRIAALSPYAQAAAIGRLEAKLTLPERRITGAPAPVKTVTGGTSAGSATPDLGELSYEDYRKQRMGKSA